MAAFSTCSCGALRFLILFSSLQALQLVSPAEFEVGGKDGWTIPKKSVEEMYNQWASNNRFRVNDTIRERSPHPCALA